MDKLPRKIKTDVIPSWVIDPSNTLAQEAMKEWLISYYLTKKFGDKWDAIKDDDYARAKAMAQAHLDAMVHAAELEHLSQSTFYDIGTDIEEHKMYQFADQEYESIMEFLMDRLEEYMANPNSGSRYETQSLISVLIWLKEQGIYLPEFMHISKKDSFSKARVATRPIKEIIQNEKMPLEEKESAIREVLEDVGDPEMRVIPFRQKYGDISQEAMGIQEPITAEWYLSSSGEEFIVIHTNGYRGTQVVQTALKKIGIMPDVKDLSNHYAFLTREVSPKSSGMVKYRYYPARDVLEEDTRTGMALPRPEDMARKLEAIIITHLEFINKVVESDEIILPVFTLVRNSEKVEDLVKAFGSPMKEDEDWVLLLESKLVDTFSLSGRSLSYLKPYWRADLQIRNIEKNWVLVLRLEKISRDEMMDMLIESVM